MTISRIIVSTGEPAGIGPDILLDAIQHNFDAEIVVIGDPELFAERAQQLNLPVNIEVCSLNDKPTQHRAGQLKILPLSLKAMCKAGQLDSKNARYVLDVLDLGIDACVNAQATALVTGPIQKSILTHEIENFTGHTEYLADRTKSALPVMMLATEGLRVALVTTHMPLSEVPSHITTENLSQVIEILHHDMKTQFGITNPKIVVAGLNPHAGEDGHLGREEIEIITPVIKHFIKQGMNLIGPLPADTLFTDKYLHDADVVLAMYHDQGLPVLKYKGFGNAINVTLGLSIVRTSVDHGTALELAGSGKANSQSMLLAINTACEITNES